MMGPVMGPAIGILVLGPVMGPAIGILVIGPSTYWISILYLSCFSRHPEHEDSTDAPEPSSPRTRAVAALSAATRTKGLCFG